MIPLRLLEYGERLNNLFGYGVKLPYYYYTAFNK